MLISIILFFGFLFIVSLDSPGPIIGGRKWESAETTARKDFLKSRPQWVGGYPKFKHGQAVEVKTLDQLINNEPGVTKYWDSRLMEAVDKLEDY